MVEKKIVEKNFLMKKASFSHEISTENKSVIRLKATLLRVSGAKKGGALIRGGALIGRIR